MKRVASGRTLSFCLADSWVSSSCLSDFWQIGSWGWDPSGQDSVPGFEEVGRFAVGRFPSPSHIRRDTRQTLVRSRSVVPLCKSVQIDLNRVGDSDFFPPGVKTLFQSAEQAFDSAVLPGAEGVGGLFADAEQPKREAHQAGIEEGLVVRAQVARFAARFDHIEQQPQDPDCVRSFRVFRQSSARVP